LEKKKKQNRITRQKSNKGVSQPLYGYEPYLMQIGSTSGRELPRRQPRFSRRVRNIASVTVLDLRRTSRIRHQELLSISYLPDE
jgi:hypothetical protein